MKSDLFDLSYQCDVKVSQRILGVFEYNAYLKWSEITVGSFGKFSYLDKKEPLNKVNSDSPRLVFEMDEKIILLGTIYIK